MGSLRHQREHDFDFRAHPDSTTEGDTVGPKAPEDAADETAAAHGEESAWPTGARESVVPPP